MRLSDLQKYILLKGLDKSGKFTRDKLTRFYDQHHRKTKPKQRIKAITRSLERLINKELMIGYGMRTPHKWFIKEIKLTAKGRQVMLKLLNKQQKLPFKLKAKNAKRKTKA
jgi:hypothetical protein